MKRSENGVKFRDKKIRGGLIEKIKVGVRKEKRKKKIKDGGTKK